MKYYNGQLLDFDSLNFPYEKSMRDCIQDSVYHAEGDVWTHTKMVANCVDKTETQLLTALYHDVHKPLTRTEINVDERVKVSHPNHSRLGAMEAWYDMWRHGGIDLQTRLSVYWMCRWHQKVFHMWSQTDMLKNALMYASVSDWSNLIKFAQADNMGRICPNQQEAIDSLELLTEWLEENNINNWEWDEYSRLSYFEKVDRSPFYKDQKTTGSYVILLSGLPGSGKDTYCNDILNGVPVISLDNIRKSMKVSWNDDQGKVIQYAKECAREYLRKKHPFIWNSTNITKHIRQQIIGLFRQYDAYVDIRSFDINMAELLKQNRNRENMVPENVILNLSKKWEPPSLLEAHRLEWISR